MTTAATTDKEAKKEALKARSEDMAKREKELNASRTGKGTRVALGMTRGKGTQEVQWEAFDDAQPETLPTTLSEFMEITKTSDEKVIVSYLIDGFNSAMYLLASDPVGEYVEPTWPEEVQKGFRLVVRNYATNAGVSIEDAVALIKPGIVASQAAAAKK